MCHPFLLFFPRISLRINIFHTLRSLSTKPVFQASARPQVHQVGGRQEPGRDFLGGQLQTLEVDGLKASCLNCFHRKTHLLKKQNTGNTLEIRNQSGNKLHQTSKMSEHAIGLQGALLPAVRHSGLSGRV